MVESVLMAIAHNDFKRCIAILETEITKNNEDALIDFFLRSVLFWQKRVESVQKLPKLLDKARYLLNEWEKYRVFCAEIEDTVPDIHRYLFIFRKAISKMALAFLTTALHDPLVNEQEVYLSVARCHKGAGRYEQAIASYRRVFAHSEQRATAYAELGDCYLLIGNELIGRLFLREAFYIDPDDIEFRFLESKLLTNLVHKLRNTEGVPAGEHRTWLPVYAVLWDIFTVRRDLKTAEYGLLRQKIYALEREYSETKERVLEPRLLYCYFYLLDYCYKMGGARVSIDEIMIKIKGINPTIYNMYIERKSAI